MRRFSRGAAGRSGWTLVELVIVVVILAMLSMFAWTRYVSLVESANVASVRASLDALRSGIRVFYYSKYVDNQQRYPTLAELSDTEANAILASNAIPPNVFDLDGDPTNLVDATGVVKGTVIGSSGGWAYRPDTGELWANTATGDIHENLF